MNRRTHDTHSMEICATYVCVVCMCVRDVYVCGAGVVVCGGDVGGGAVVCTTCARRARRRMRMMTGTGVSYVGAAVRRQRLFGGVRARERSLRRCAHASIRYVYVCVCTRECGPNRGSERAEETRVYAVYASVGRHRYAERACALSDLTV